MLPAGRSLPTSGLSHNFETIISGEMIGTSTQLYTFVIYDDTGQKTRLN